MEYTPQKAIADIDEVLNSTVYYDESLEYELSSYDFDWLEVAKSALEKQIPKKPIKELNEIVCPNCKALVGSSPYCRYCGQKIEKLDWSECNEEKND